MSDSIVAQGLFVKLGRGFLPSWKERTWALFRQGCQLSYFEPTNMPLHLVGKDSALYKGDIDLTSCTIKDGTAKKVVAKEVALQLTSKDGRSLDCVFANPDAARLLLAGLAKCGHPGVATFYQAKGWSLAEADPVSAATTPEDAPSSSPPPPSTSPTQDDEASYKSAHIEPIASVASVASVAVGSSSPIESKARSKSSLRLLAGICWILFAVYAGLHPSPVHLFLLFALTAGCLLGTLGEAAARKKGD